MGGRNIPFTRVPKRGLCSVILPGGDGRRGMFVHLTIAFVALVGAGYGDVSRVEGLTGGTRSREDLFVVSGVVYPICRGCIRYVRGDRRGSFASVVLRTAGLYRG